MTYLDELVEKLGVDSLIVEEAINANGFFDKKEFSAQEVYLLRLYVDYLAALEDVKDAQHAFKYTDGEESVDKSNVYDQVRRTANDVMGKWRQAKSDYDAKTSGNKAFFTLRKRARFLDEQTR